MKIEQSNVSLFSSYQKNHKIEEIESLHMWKDKEVAPERVSGGDRLELSKEFKKMEHEAKQINSENYAFDVELDPKLMAIIRALEALTGKKINLSMYHHADSSKTLDSAKVEASKGSEQNTQPQRLGWGMEYSYSRSEISSEELSFSASGSVSTKDGTQIDFKLAFSMSRSVATHESLSFKAGDALIDPLVLNFDGNTVTMGSIKHRFDLDLDGKDDEFSFVGSTSGFLALDKNGDGKINDGSELFGPTLGNGFDELAAYDEDGNAWIDESDAIFEKLLIWTKDENGNEELYTLKEKNVGALYLNSASTTFDLEDAQNNQVAKMRESSLYLSEDGGAGTLQEVDLRV
ncbi:MAG: hypothetical protein A3E21_03290 [Sulfurimonas sp. RIFCSPHIGHO2_12_FULL_36_9]|uniref:hypothetical protein n=1 Tax=Sulfurimonas sp. RIFCSPLOWO2_12_36_12 TaxID=1802253 RepID=UPI0008B37820|nr:hypothetical protein [Sulfurimonas sp. RIFCSPLOWO2_12_36_12]OHD99397.1 MAG: hypothetical protein A3E21_03290 [Sulfurimonas sp. RIFCSPHIGHO2_12_FULL_36_9]OHD99846.1 MAG: hypothetical protein A3J26_07045 [Sulfurimonas sp. RIFCSPLOWO2_02_FULL_36_28]OHE02382.1 MAG: hypothetical protein A2W82_09810 [Sulfurimonas sp. RIFCSPLOWO2_12_36_12]OHE02664.1 MAG: hypothetical protein A3K14_07085 [Sulfurimonas sp. RIFCSPLOWO2_12_FULL_36_74]